MRYRYTLLRQDGTKEEIGIYTEELKFSGKGGLYELLGNIDTIELIPNDYYEYSHKINITLDLPIICMYGDEESRYNTENHRNPWFAFFNTPGGVFDIVGDVIAEEEVS